MSPGWGLGLPGADLAAPGLAKNPSDFWLTGQGHGHCIVDFGQKNQLYFWLIFGQNQVNF